MTVSASNGVKFYIGTTKPATDATSYASDTFTEVKDIKDLGEFGDEATEIKFETLGDNRTRRLPGTKDAGNMDIMCVNDNGDAGQIAMKAAAAGISPLNTNFKVLLNDSGTVGGGSVYYFSGVVLSAKRKAGSANNTIDIDFKVGINTAIFEVAAAA